MISHADKLLKIKSLLTNQGISSAKKQDFPNGIYTGIVASHTEGETKNVDPKIDYSVEVLSGPEGSSVYKGCKATLSNYFSKTGIYHVAEFIGKIPFYDTIEEFWEKPEKLYGYRIEFVVSHRNCHQNLSLNQIFDKDDTSTASSV